MSRIVFAVVLVLTTLAASAEARRYRGEWSNAFAGDVENLRFRLRGRLTEGQTTIRGRLLCRRCPVRGRLELTCAGGYCTGTISNGCTAAGYYYSTQFEGTYDCNGNPVGVLSFGRRR